MDVTFRPIDQWPQPPTKARRRSQFKAGYSSTLELLDRELGHLNARRVVVQLHLEEREIRLDGMPRANTRPSSPGVILSFESKHGPLRYLTDVFDRWEDNLRAIALGLEALRKVDRYGITRRGEQYTGWRAIEGGGSSESGARALLDSYGGLKAALRATHPDRGGDVEEFRRVQEAREVLGL